MAVKNINDSGRIFRSPVLEALTKTHIAFPLTMFYGTGIAALLLSLFRFDQPVVTSIVLFVVGLFFFTLVEYLVHRYFYHMETDSPRKARIQYIFHGVHHDHPRDKKRLALPPLMSALVAAMFIGLYILAMGMPGLAFGGGFMVGYASYLLAHYAIHVYNPPKNFLGVIWHHAQRSDGPQESGRSEVLNGTIPDGRGHGPGPAYTAPPRPSERPSDYH
jgi:sterol desaturase/sphingolipid hydroxylase (fatty acid hydroxylase superfamily)